MGGTLVLPPLKFTYFIYTSVIHNQFYSELLYISPIQLNFYGTKRMEPGACRSRGVGLHTPNFAETVCNSIACQYSIIVFQ